MTDDLCTTALMSSTTDLRHQQADDAKRSKVSGATICQWPCPISLLRYRGFKSVIVRAA